MSAYMPDHFSKHTDALMMMRACVAWHGVAWRRVAWRGVAWRACEALADWQGPRGSNFVLADGARALPAP